VQSAAACLNLGRAREAAQIVAALDLPPVSFEGAALMRAIGRRLGVAGPEVAVAGHPRALERELIERLASVHDAKCTVARALEPVFNPDLFRVAPSTALFDPALHPRWPAGRPDGGQFRPRDGEGAVVPVQWQGPALRVAARLLARLLGLLRRVPKLPKPGEAPPPGEPVPKPDTSTPAQQKPPGIGHNGPPADEATAPEAGSRGDAAPEPPLDESEPFELPAERPTGKGAVARWGRRVADEIHDAIERGDADRLAEIADALSRADWIKDQLDNIVAAQDPPRSLDDLIDAAQDKGPRPGYDDHHIIEQGPQNSDLPEEVVEARNNIVRIPRYKHWQINEYYQARREDLGWQTPREYLKGKSTEERYQFGLRVLRDVGVLK
jgi:hypothetical protein